MPDSLDRAETSTEARMVIEPDAVHEGEDELFLDCPQCGSTTTITRILSKGRCSGYLDADAAESKTEDKQLLDPICTAKLSLELVWES